MRGLISGCILLIVATTTAVAQSRSSAGSSPLSHYKGFDRFLAWATVWGNTKGDGVYTCDEWKAYASKLFKDADRNRDGYVDAEEFKTIQQADPMFKEADLAYFDDNRDGRLSRSEFVDKPNPFFVRYDRKGTCRVTLDDISDEAEQKSGRSQRR
jgi:hypothetical protein